MCRDIARAHQRKYRLRSHLPRLTHSVRPIYIIHYYTYLTTAVEEDKERIVIRLKQQRKLCYHPWNTPSPAQQDWSWARHATTWIINEVERLPANAS
jgi:hypothetical protein